MYVCDMWYTFCVACSKWIEKFDDVAEEDQRRIRQTMFPPSKQEVEKFHLDRYVCVVMCTALMIHVHMNSSHHTVMAGA